MNSIQRRRSSLVVAVLSLAASIVACSAPPPASGTVSADQVEIVRGVPDRGDDPAVIAINIGGDELCSGSLIAPNVVLTAHHCVAKTSEQVNCPATSVQVGSSLKPETLTILVGDDITTARPRARGAEILTPRSSALCNADIALIVLDELIDDVAPLDVRAHGIAKGDHVRAIGFGRAGDGAPAGVKLVRDHVLVLDTTDDEFIVGQATCQGDSGGPAIDEDTGEIVGVVSRGGPTCDGTNVHNVYTRSDAFLSLVDEALAKGKTRAATATTHKDAGKAAKPKPDFGTSCSKGSECAAGVCVSEGTKRYCSRDCDAHDRCPTHFKCEKANNGESVCVEN